jgi:hypothetical protein
VNFCAFDHQGKSRMLCRTLLDAGWAHTEPEQADVLLIDIDDPDAPGRGDLISRSHGLVVLYPHGALPTYLGFYKPEERIDIQLVHGSHTVWMLENLGLWRVVKAVGWSYSPWVDYQPPAKVDRVLFGPIHPYGSGELDEPYKRENARVFAALQELDVEVTVQMFGSAQTNGLPEPLGAVAVRSSLLVDWRWVDQADLVVAEGTLACLALARGKPVVMFGQSLPQLDEHDRPKTGVTVRFPRYPVDFDDGLLPELFAAACADVGGWWRDGFVGGPFNTDAFLDVLEAQLVAA